MERDRKLLSLIADTLVFGVFGYAEKSDGRWVRSLHRTISCLNRSACDAPPFRDRSELRRLFETARMSSQTRCSNEMMILIWQRDSQSSRIGNICSLMFRRYQNVLLILLCLTCSITKGQGISDPEISNFVRDLKSTDKIERLHAIKALERMGPNAAEAVNPLITLLDDDDDVRYEAANALRSIGRLAVPALINALKSPNPRVRATAAYALVHIGYGNAKAATALIEALNDNNKEVRSRAAEALGSIKPDNNEVVPALMRLLRDQDAEIRQDAVSALGEIGPEARPATPLIIELLNDHDVDVRIKAINALSTIEPGADAEAAVPFLIEQLNNKDTQLRYILAKTLGSIGPTAIPALTDALKSSNVLTRRGAAESLMRMGPEAVRATSELSLSLKDQDSEVRTLAAAALGQIGEGGAKAAVPVLIQSLKDGDNIVRYTAAEALGRMGAGAQASIPALTDAIYDEDRNVRVNAAAAIERISVALYKVQAINQIGVLKRAYSSMIASSDPVAQRHAEAVKQTIDYLELLQQRQLAYWIEEHLYITVIIIIYPILLLVCIILLYLKPIWLLQINETLSRNIERLPKKVGGVDIPLRYGLLVGFFHYHPRVLDAWVNSHIKIVREQVFRKHTVKDREVYVPVTLTLDDENITTLLANRLRTVFSKNLANLLISGEGGSGKTSLACFLAKWAMSEERENWLRPHLMIPVLIEPDLQLQTKGTNESLLIVIRDQLRVLVDETDSIPLELLRQLLKKQRVLVIIDSLSEMDETTRADILLGIIGLPVNATIITSRLNETLNGLPKNIIRPLRIEGNRLSNFMHAYLSGLEKRDLFDDEEFFDACRQLSLIVGDRDVTALLAKLYAEQIIAIKEGTTNDDLPTNIPDLILQFIGTIYHNSPANSPPFHIVLSSAEVIAWQCLQKTHRPIPAPRKEVLMILGGDEKALQHVRYLEHNLKIIQTIGAGRDRIKFTFDPLAEYLAGLHLVNEYGNNEELWCAFLHHADEQEGGPESIREFLLATRDCCINKGTDACVPDFVADKLAEKAGLDQEYKQRQNIERKLKRLMQGIKSPDAEDRAKAAMALGTLKNDTANITIPTLIELLGDQDPTVRSAVADTLGSIGPSAEVAVLPLIKLLKDPNPYVSRTAAEAISSIGMKAEAAIPALIELLKGQNENARLRAADAIGKYKQKAYIAVPDLIGLLGDSNELIRGSAAEALRRIGSPAISALNIAAQDEDPRVKEIAQQVLKKIERTIHVSN